MLSKAKPIFGHMGEFTKDRFQLFTRGFEEAGSIFSIRLGPKKAAVLTHPEHVKKYFKETDKSLNLQRPNKHFRKVVGEIGVLMDNETYLNERPMLYASFTREKLLYYLEVINYAVQLWLDKLGTAGTMDFAREMEYLAQQIISRCILGNKTHESIGEEFWEHFFTLGRNIDHMIPPNLPHPKNYRRNKARKAVAKVLAPIIKARREHPEQYNDIVKELVNVPLKDGRLASDELCLSYVLNLLLAGHETTSAQGAWVIIHLLQHPDYLKRVQAEIDAKMPYGTGITAKSMAQMPYLRWAIDETTRLKPSGDMIMRMADAEYEVDGFTIPKDWMVILYPGVLHRHPDYFEHPHDYDPMRYSPDRPDKGASRNLIYGFGGGVHKCAGMSLAKNEMTGIAALLLQQYDLELVTKDPVHSYGAGFPRCGPALIKYRRKDLSQVIPQEVQEEAAAAGCPHFNQE